MFNKSNILKIIKDHEKEMAEIRIELMKTDSDIVKKELRRKLGLLEDDLCRYKLQAKNLIEYGIVGNMTLTERCT